MAAYLAVFHYPTYKSPPLVPLLSQVKEIL